LLGIASNCELGFGQEAVDYETIEEGKAKEQSSVIGIVYDLIEEGILVFTVAICFRQCCFAFGEPLPRSCVHFPSLGTRDVEHRWVEELEFARVLMSVMSERETSCNVVEYPVDATPINMESDRWLPVHNHGEWILEYVY
jgi:hypothetical protein